MSKKSNKTPWYIAGLHFKCQTCGSCCSGPGEGYIWLTKDEIQFIVDFLKIPIGQIRKKFLKRLGWRTSIIEHPVTKDCIFLQEIDGRKGCIIYSVRPNQCRTWPFWPDNLASANKFNTAAQTCPGINRGKLYTFEEIQKIKKKRKWWSNEDQQRTDKKND